MPSAACAAQAATSFGFPSTDTRQIRQFPTVGSFGYQHSVGTSTLSERAASRMVAPSGAVTATPSIVSFGIQPRRVSLAQGLWPWLPRHNDRRGANASSDEALSGDAVRDAFWGSSQRTPLT